METEGIDGERNQFYDSSRERRSWATQGGHHLCEFVVSKGTYKDT